MVSLVSVPSRSPLPHSGLILVESVISLHLTYRRGPMSDSGGYVEVRLLSVLIGSAGAMERQMNSAFLKETEGESKMDEGVTPELLRNFFYKSLETSVCLS